VSDFQTESDFCQIFFELLKALESVNMGEKRRLTVLSLSGRL